MVASMTDDYPHDPELTEYGNIIPLAERRRREGEE